MKPVVLLITLSFLFAGLSLQAEGATFRDGTYGSNICEVSCYVSPSASELTKKLVCPDALRRQELNVKQLNAGTYISSVPFQNNGDFDRAFSFATGKHPRPEPAMEGLSASYELAEGLLVESREFSRPEQNMEEHTQIRTEAKADGSLTFRYDEKSDGPAYQFQKHISCRLEKIK
ncbi:MAG: hypothetical protein ACXWQO_11520 [Bdellovibrionota bacterium]